MTPYWVPRPQWVYEKIHWPRSLLGTKYEMIFKSMSSVTKDIPYIVLTNELYDVCCEEINLVLTLRPSDAIWWHESGSTFAQAITCSLTAPSHYQNQYWHTVRCRYNAVNFLQNPHNRHPIARPWGSWEVLFTFSYCHRIAVSYVISW